MLYLGLRTAFDAAALQVHGVIPVGARKEQSRTNQLAL